MVRAIVEALASAEALLMGGALSTGAASGEVAKQLSIDAPGGWCRSCGRSMRSLRVGEACAGSADAVEADARGSQLRSRCSRCPRTVDESPWPLVRLGEHHGALRDAILAIKYHRADALAAALGTRLARQWRDSIDGVRGADARDAPLRRAFTQARVQAIPMPWLRRLDRGRDHATLIADAFAESLGLRRSREIVQRWRGPQARLGGAARRNGVANEKRRFRPARGSRGEGPARGALILVDDVMTTGRTLLEASQVLRKLGFAPIGAAVLAVSHDHF